MEKKKERGNGPCLPPTAALKERARLAAEIPSVSRILESSMPACNNSDLSRTRVSIPGIIDKARNLA